MIIPFFPHQEHIEQVTCMDCGVSTDRHHGATRCYFCLEKHRNKKRVEQQAKFKNAHKDYWKMYQPPQEKIAHLSPPHPIETFFCLDCKQPFARGKITALRCWDCRKRKRQENQRRMHKARRAKQK